MPYKTGQVLKDKYQIEKLVGSGGFAEVYLATHLELHARRALKVLRRGVPGMGSSEYRRFEERFETEAALGAKLDEINHPNLVRVYDFEHDEQNLILVMEYCPGGSLASRLQDAQRKGERLPLDEIIRIGIETAQGLSELHRLDVVHRDLKPSNILFDQHGRAKVADLGLAQTPESRYIRLGQGSLSVDHPGTVEYMPPEQQTGRSDPLRASADVYALGSVLFEALSGRMLFHQKLGARPRDLRPDTPKWLDELVLRMLAEDPKQRPWDANEVIELLQQGQAQEKRQRRAMAGIAAALVLLGIAVMVGVILLMNVSGNDAERTAVAHSMQMTQTSFAALQATEKANAIEPTEEPIVTLGLEPLSSDEPSDEPTATQRPTEQPTATLALEPPAIASQGDTWTSPVDGMVMAYIPAGEFEMGSNNGEDDEKPVHTVSLDAFWMDVTEVTNAQYRLCVDDGICAPLSNVNSKTRDYYHGNSEFDQYPVIRVTWKQAQQYCAWRGANLPTEAQWEKAARGDLDGMRYPWGNDSPVCQVSAENGAQSSNCSPFDTNQVGLFSPNGYGIFDMAGNVWEWVYDWYSQDYYKVTQSKNPQGPEQGTYRVARGGAFDEGSGVMRVANRSRDVPVDTPLTIGFRCAR